MEQKIKIIDRTNECLVHAMIFFLKETKHCYLLKLLKLLYFFDEKHIKETGISVTGLDYFAWDMGPVPEKLYQAIKQPEKLKEYFDFQKPKDIKKTTLIPKKEFNKKLFSKRQQRIMDNLVNIYKDEKSDVMSRASHDRNGAWYKVFHTENKKNKKIPYELHLDTQESKDRFQDHLSESEEIKKNFNTDNSVDIF